jgi:hypothetical protein
MNIINYKIKSYEMIILYNSIVIIEGYRWIL